MAERLRPTILCAHLADDVAFVARFWARVGPPDAAGCQPWRGARQRQGYGNVRKAPHNYRAHRVAYVLRHGEVPPGLEVLHRCDNRVCCADAHVFLGTNRDNIADRMAKGRSLVGVRNHQAKRTPEIVREIRARLPAMSRGALGRRYGVSDGTIRFIAKGVTWREVPA